MKMKLKNNIKLRKKIKLNIKLSKKNIFIFLISLLIISFISGIIFYLNLNINDKDVINKNINCYFVLKDNYDYLSLFLKSNFNNILNTGITWLLGISIIGIALVLFIFFSSFFSLGFSISAIISIYGAKGVVISICYLLFSKLLVLFNTFIITFFAINISIKLFKVCFLKYEINIKEEIKKYNKIFLFCLCISIISSIFEVFVDPLMIKLYQMIV